MLNKRLVMGILPLSFFATNLNCLAKLEKTYRIYLKILMKFVVINKAIKINKCLIIILYYQSIVKKVNLKMFVNMYSKDSRTSKTQVFLFPQENALFF